MKVYNLGLLKRVVFIVLIFVVISLSYLLFSHTTTVKTPPVQTYFGVDSREFIKSDAIDGFHVSVTLIEDNENELVFQWRIKDVTIPMSYVKYQYVIVHENNNTNELEDLRYFARGDEFNNSLWTPSDGDGLMVYAKLDSEEQTIYRDIVDVDNSLIVGIDDDEIATLRLINLHEVVTQNQVLFSYTESDPKSNFKIEALYLLVNWKDQFGNEYSEYIKFDSNDY